MMIRVPNAAGSDMSAYMALPKAGKGPGIVVCQEIFGVTDSLKKVCDYLAARQFTAICPDLYWSVEPGVVVPENEYEPARALRAKVNDGAVVKDIGAAMAFLRKHEACTGAVGVVGFCWGGLLAYLTATEEKPDAAVSYYGVGIEKHLDSASKVACPMLLHYGGLDAAVPPEAVAKVSEALPNATVLTYPDGNHAFARPGGVNYHHKSADLADMRTVAFMTLHLIGKGKVGLL
ncbi:MAG: dienelactone hydrolase family protein [Acidobacteriota bacterium]